MANEIEFLFAPADKPIDVDWPCTFSRPANGGTFDTYAILVRFRVVSDTKIGDAFDYNMNLVTGGKYRREFLAGRTVIGAEGADDTFEPGVVLGFPALKAEGSSSEVVGMKADVIADVLSKPYVLDGIANGYLEMIGRGEKGAAAGRRTKN